MFKNLIIAGAAALGLTAVQGSASAADSAAPASVLTIHIRNFRFVPMAATVHAGDRVTFVNDDPEAHTATSDDKSFDSAGLDSGQTWQHVFAAPGRVSYFCELHPYMRATIVVLPAVPAAARSGQR